MRVQTDCASLIMYVSTATQELISINTRYLKITVRPTLFSCVLATKIMTFVDTFLVNLLT